MYMDACDHDCKSAFVLLYALQCIKCSLANTHNKNKTIKIQTNISHTQFPIPEYRLYIQHFYDCFNNCSFWKLLNSKWFSTIRKRNTHTMNVSYVWSCIRKINLEFTRNKKRNEIERKRVEMNFFLFIFGAPKTLFVVLMFMCSSLSLSMWLCLRACI